MMNLDLTDKQFEGLMKAIDTDGDLKVSYEEFMDFMRKQEEEHNTKSMLPVVSGIPVEAAVKLIREKITSRVGGQKDGLMRAFKIIDIDGTCLTAHGLLIRNLRPKLSSASNCRTLGCHVWLVSDDVQSLSI